MIQLLAVGAGGFVGAVARFGVSTLVQRLAGTSFPYATFVVNVVGCFVLGALMGVVEDRQGLSEPARLFLAIGLLGSFTTFSTFGWETYALLRDGRLLPAVAYVVGSAAVGLVAVALGRGLLRLAA